ncbi:Clavaminate synthase-like protein [Ephemerocybe angulata]|uniref:Clavaminate synthase-like protein n=1 Tax=Ephemerocybe angulata TaxID=980116 RepID=A0A8H6HMW7_9AGAR|nr:Clavaminate synthase-like protein [Tulosesus angulatus]
MPVPPTLPPFPEDLPTQDLLVVDFEKLAAENEEEGDLLWKAATEFGFWYMKNHGIEELTEPMFEMGRETLALPMEEKMKFWQGNSGDSFGYKAAGATFSDFNGNTDVAEFLNVSKDDALSYPSVVHRAYPLPVQQRMHTAVQPFVRQCVRVCEVMLKVFERKLGLGEGELGERHRVERESICETRCIKVPPTRERKATALGAHTDFGSLSILFNKLGGLQVLTPNTRDDWKYVKPLPGHAICNIGDTLDLLTGGILRSSYHRVQPPPGEQAEYERWSLVYFYRPSNDVEIAPLITQCSLIADAAKNPPRIPIPLESGTTASQWFKKRQGMWRTDSEKGIESYIATGGKYEPKRLD